jgi:hypothetical protein
MVQHAPENTIAEHKPRPTPRPQVEVLAHDVPSHCQITNTGRSTAYKAMNSDAGKRDGLPFLPSFTVGKRRLILVEDSREWLAKLRAASLGKAAATPDASQAA